MSNPSQAEDSPKLIRGIGLTSAISLNMTDMIGVGPFITLPLIVSAMGGPQAMLGWIAGAIFALCDGLIWAELGAAMPGSGGSYHYLREIYGPMRLGKLISFLFIWQLSFSAPLSIASGSIGLAGYASYYWPGLEHQYVARNWDFASSSAGSVAPSLVNIRGHAAGSRSRHFRGVSSLSQDNQHRMDVKGSLAWRDDYDRLDYFRGANPF